ncbi:MAG: Rpn family recombination-promoting nuclease/putative transposase [Planctomycetaceae bacterium]|jgi:hypothetical protein|nr:Rpn family recombination-promoting nuclease/putative transposase [Planctomycetaceae bacterium]
MKTKKITKQKIIKQPNNPHDRFARKTLGNPSYASDFLKYYASPIIIEFVHLDKLIASPTHYLTNELKEIILDVAFAACLRDKRNGSEVLMFLEHKSKPNRLVPLQIGTHCFLSLYFGWTTTEYSETYQPPIPLMIIVYHGKDDINEEMFFQEIFQNIPEKLRPYVPQFKLFVINLKRFSYNNLPGKPETQAIAESLKRATDGTFGNHLSEILEHVKKASLNKQQTIDLTTSITQYCTWTHHLTSEEVVQSIKNVFNGTEGIKMATTIKKGILQEGIEIGEARGKVIGKLQAQVNGILAILRKRFVRVPRYIVNSLNQRTDAVALESLLILAATCSSLDEFVAEL